MNLPNNTVTYLADIADPTSDGILTRFVNFGISALMVVVVLLGAWYAFQEWMGSHAAGDPRPGAKAPSRWAGMRNVAVGVIVIEAILGGVLVLANYGTGLVPSFL